MGANSIIRHRTQAKEIRLSGKLVMTKSAWLALGGIYRGTVGQAAQKGYYTVRGCEKLGKPVSAEELENCKDFALFKDCYTKYMIYDSDFILRCPCLPVFYRGQVSGNDNKGATQ